MSRCCVDRCGHLQNRDPCKMFLFPTNKNLRDAWKNSIRSRKPVTVRTKICECHFPNKDRLSIPSLKLGTQESIGEKGFEQVIEVTDSSFDEEEVKKMYDLQARVEELEVELAHQRKIYEYQKDRVTFFHLKDNVRAFHSYTSLRDIMDFQMIACDVIETANDLNVTMHEDLSVEEQILMTMMKLRKNFELADLAFRFRVSESVAHNIITTIIHLMASKYVGDCCVPPPIKPAHDLTIDRLNMTVRLEQSESNDIELKVLLLIKNKKVIGKSLAYPVECTNEQIFTDWQKKQISQDSMETCSLEDFQLNELTGTTSHFCKMLTFFEILSRIPERFDTLVNEILTVCIGISKQKSSKINFEELKTS